MNILSLFGAFLITLALLSYGIASIAIQRFKIVTTGMIIFLSLGVILDLVAIAFMISGSTNGIFTLHGILGYSATITMVTDLFLILRKYFKNGFDSVINNSVLLFSKIAYAWYLLVYITGSLLIIWP
ncbi:MAG TPA: hypothetical protein P5210_11745 [Draconibacterium sp.]|nr:hypothetical protein [Draconibacterium sp.]HRX12318.1 hypothetical protein [Draconibacterium sp.]